MVAFATRMLSPHFTRALPSACRLYPGVTSILRSSLSRRSFLKIAHLVLAVRPPFGTQVHNVNLTRRCADDTCRVDVACYVTCDQVQNLPPGFIVRRESRPHQISGHYLRGGLGRIHQLHVISKDLLQGSPEHRIVGAAHDDHIEIGSVMQVVSDDLLCHLAVCNALLDYRDEEGAGPRPARDPTAFQPLLINAAGDGVPGPEDAHQATTAHLSRGLHSRFDHAPHRYGKFVCQFRQAHRRSGIAGYDNPLDLPSQQLCRDLAAEALNEFTGFAPIGNPGCITQVDEPLARQALLQGMEDGKPANP